MHKKGQQLISLDEISAHIQEPVSVDRSLAFFEHVHEFKFDDTSQVTVRLVVRKSTAVVKNYSIVLPESVVQKCLDELDSFVKQETTSATGRVDSIIDAEEEEARRNRCRSLLSCRVFSTTDLRLQNLAAQWLSTAVQPALAILHGHPSYRHRSTHAMASALQDNEASQRDLRYQVYVLMGQCIMTYVYPLFLFAFVSLPSIGQSILTFLLPGIKILLKNYFHRSLHDLDDIKPAFIVFNVDIFSAFYVANCLQAPQTWTNALLIMVVDIVQMAISLFDLRMVINEVHSLVRVDQFKVQWLASGFVRDGVKTSGDTKRRKELDHRNSSLRTLVEGSKRFSTVASGRMVVPDSVPRPGPPSAAVVQEALAATGLTPANRVRLVHKIAKALYMAEFFSPGGICGSDHAHDLWYLPAGGGTFA